MTEDTSPDNQPTEQPTEPRTLRGGLRARRAEAVSKLFVDRRVPRMDPPVFVRFGPLPQEEIDKAQKHIDNKSKGDRRNVVANANALATSCLGIYELDEHNEKRSVVPEVDNWTDVRFDDKLGRELGHESMIRASDVVQALYLTDGDIISEAGEITEWSGYARRDGDEDYSGN